MSINAFLERNVNRFKWMMLYQASIRSHLRSQAVTAHKLGVKASGKDKVVWGR